MRAPTIALVALALACVLVASPLCAEYTVLVRSQTLDTNDLDRIQAEIPEKLFAHSYKIPYSTLEPQIEQALGGVVDQVIQSELGGYSQTYECDYPCDWVSWQILNPALTFRFTDESQPEITALGNGTAVEVRFRTAARIRYTGKVRGRINTDFTSPATPGGTDEEDFPFDIRIDASVDGLLRLNLYPNLSVDQFSVIFDDDAKVSINGVEDYLTAKGAELGTKIGFTPGGIITGGPLAWGLTGALFGNEGGEILEEWLETIGQTYISAGVEQGFAEISNQLEEIVGAADVQAQNFQQQLLSSSVPGTGKTVTQLQSGLGVSLDVRAETPGTDVIVTITLRMNPNPAGKTIVGQLLIPKTKCIEGYNETLGSIPGPTIEVNQEFAAEVGKPCDEVLPNDPRTGLASRVFLGHEPPGTSLPLWEGFGQVQLQGTLADKDDFYRCGFRVSALPAAAVVEIGAGSGFAGSIGSEHRTGRFLLAGNVLLDHTFDRVRTAHLGGATGCSGGGAGGSGLQLGGPAAVAEEIENCPQCGPLSQRPGSEQSNPAGVVSTGAREQGFNPQPDPPGVQISRVSELVAGSPAEIGVTLQLPSARPSAAGVLSVQVEVFAGRKLIHRSTEEVAATARGAAEVTSSFTVPRGAPELRFVATVYGGSETVTTTDSRTVRAPSRR